MSSQKPKYHHGDLRAALIQAADELIAEGGLETFSLRAAAQRAGVSPGAPAHHFGSASGLLTEVALLAYERSGGYLEKVGHSDDVATDLRALSHAFVTFALEHPGHFRLMFRTDLVNREDPRLHRASGKPGRRLVLAAAAYHGKSELNLEHFEDSVDIFCALATLHGLSHMVLAGKANYFFGNSTHQDFLENALPRILEQLYPSTKQNA